MILVDTSVWIDHLRAVDTRLVLLLEEGAVLTHPSVVGELALGNLRHRGEFLRLLQGLPMTTVATDAEVLAMIEGEALHGVGIGYVDSQLLGAARLTPGARLWTRERRLATVARRLGLDYSASGR